MPRRLSPGYIHAIHPDHGEAVVYTPGQLLPEWVCDRLDAGAPLLLDDLPDSFTLGDVPPKGARPRAGERAS